MNYVMKGFLMIVLSLMAMAGFGQGCLIGAITNVTATPSSNSTQVVVSWNTSLTGRGGVKNVGINYSIIFVAGFTVPVPGGPGVQAVTVPAGTTKTITGLTPGTNYTFRVHGSSFCDDSSDDSSHYSEVVLSNSVSAIIIPDTPTLNSGTPASATAIDISWNTITGATSYDYEVSNAAGSIVSSATIAATSTNVSALLPNTNYFYRVRGRNAAGPSINFSAKSAAILTFPAAPTFPAASSVSITTTSFRANWNAVGGAASYRLDVSNDASFNSIIINNLIVNGTASPDLSGLAGGTTYFFRVRAVNSIGGTSANGNSQALTAPIVPSSFSVGTISSNSFTVNWAASLTATQYELTVATDQNFNFPIANYNAKIINAPTLTDVVNGLTVSTNYFLRLRARNAINSNSDYALTSTLSKADVPAFPATSATAITTTSFRVSWNAVAGATGYQLDVSIDPDFKSFVPSASNLPVLGTTSPDISGLTGGTVYYYRVRSVNQGGPSENSLRAEVLTAPIVPTGFSISAASPNSITVNWVNAPTASQYELFVATDQNFNFPVTNFNPMVITAPTVSKTIDNLIVLTTYYLRLRARNGSNSSSEFAFTSSATRAVGDGGIGLNSNSNEPPHVKGVTQELVANLTGNINDGIAVTLFHKKNSQADYSSTPVSLISGKYKVVIDDSWLDGFGMEFFFKAKDLSSEVTSSRSKILSKVPDVKIPVSSFGKEARNYKIISIPYQLPGRLHISDVFEQVTGLGEYDKKKWRLFHYQNGTNLEYSDGIKASNLEQGQAYWFVSKNEITLSLGEGISYGNSIDNPFKIALKKGWNQIGNPFPYGINWSDLLNLPVNSRADIDHELMTFDNDKVSFISADSLRVFEGGFVFAGSDTELTFPVTLKSKGLKTSGGKVDNNVNERIENPANWILPIQLTQGEVTNVRNGIGMNLEATDGKDSYDRITPPRFLRYVEWNSHQSGYDYNFSRDVVSPKENYKWNFNIESNSVEAVELKWDRQSAALLPAQLILYDQTKHILIDMAKLESYSTEPGANLSIHFRKNRLMETDEVMLGRAYPVPFSKELFIPYNYALEEAAYAEFTVYDVYGDLLVSRKVVTDDKDPGVQLIKWDGFTDRGNEAIPGLYLYKIRVRRGSEVINFTGKIIKHQ